MFWYKTNNKYFSIYKQNGEQTFFSEEVENVLGYEPSELIGKSAYEFFHPVDLVRISKSHFEIANENSITTVVYRIRHKNGNYVWVRSFSQNTGENLISMTKKLNQIEIILHHLTT